MPRARLSGVSPLARASARSKAQDVEKILKEADSDGDDLLSLEDLQSYLGDFLGYGQLEIRDFFDEYKNDAGKVDLAGLQKGFASLNPYLICKQKGRTIWRKPGAVCAPGSQMNLEDLVDCKVYICDKTEQAFADECLGCEVVIGACNGPTMVRDCKDCTFWLATRQLRTRDCVNCKFFLHSHTEPIIESSRDLGFAPFTVSYPSVARHVEESGMNPGRNFWNAIFDFTGRADGSNWRILALSECRELQLWLDGAGEWQCPAALSQEVLCAAPLQSDEGSGQSMAQIPQTRPQAPAPGGACSREVVRDQLPGEASPKKTETSEKPVGRKLRKPKWSKVKLLKPDSRGVNLFVKVVKVTPVGEGLAEVVVGDDTGTVLLRARGSQVEQCQPSSILRIQNALVAMFKGYMRLEVNKWGVLKPDIHEDFEVKVANDVSAVEYELAS